VGDEEGVLRTVVAALGFLGFEIDEEECRYHQRGRHRVGADRQVPVRLLLEPAAREGEQQVHDRRDVDKSQTGTEGEEDRDV
jgi:hypothetical protein